MDNMKNLWRYTSYMLIFLGILHTIFFTVSFSDVLVDILRAGLFNSIGFDTARIAAWYGGLWLGIALIVLGCFAQSWIRVTAQPLPRYLGWFLAATGLVGTVLQPASGASLVCLLGIIIIFARPRGQA